MDQRQETSQRYTIFTDSTTTIEKVRSDAIGPGQRFAVAAIEVCTRLVSRSNKVAIHWVPAPYRVQGNETTDEMAKAAAEGNHPDDAVPNELRWETSLSHMARVATDNRSRMTAEWISSHTGDPRRKYKAPRGRGLRRRLLRRTPKPIAKRYCQLLSGHAAIGSYLKDKIRKTDDDYWSWCGGGKKRTRHHLFTECRAWMPQIRKLWRDIGKAHGWKHPRAPSGKWLWKEKSTDAVLASLGSTG